MTFQNDLILLGLSALCPRFLASTILEEDKASLQQAGVLLAQDFFENWDKVSKAQRQLFFRYLEDLYCSNTPEAMALLDIDGFLPAFATEMEYTLDPRWKPDVFVNFLGEKIKIRLIIWFQVLMEEMIPPIFLATSSTTCLEQKYQVLECFINHFFPDFQSFYRDQTDFLWDLETYVQPYFEYIRAFARYFIRNFRTLSPDKKDKLFEFIECLDEHKDLQIPYSPYNTLHSSFLTIFLENVYDAVEKKGLLTRNEVRPYLGPNCTQYIKEYLHDYKWD